VSQMKPIRTERTKKRLVLLAVATLLLGGVLHIAGHTAAGKITWTDALGGDSKESLAG
jgi:predicted transcriptional regulator